MDAFTEALAPDTLPVHDGRGRQGSVLLDHHTPFPNVDLLVVLWDDGELTSATTDDVAPIL